VGVIVFEGVCVGAGVEVTGGTYGTCVFVMIGPGYGGVSVGLVSGPGYAGASESVMVGVGVFSIWV
jgi:hypothetical protein